MIRFSYFNNPKVKQLDKSEIVSVARTNYLGLPKDNLAEELFVPVDLFNDYKYNKTITFDEFYDEYVSRVLLKLNAKEIYNKYNGKVLCCHEKDILECHRSFIKLWFEVFGLEVVEL